MVLALKGRWSGRSDGSLGDGFLSCAAPDGWQGVVAIGTAAGEGGAEAKADVSPAWCGQFLQELHAAVVHAGRSQVYKQSTGSRVLKLEVKGLRGRLISVIVKQSAPGTLRQCLGTRWRGPKEWREFWNGHRLLSADVATPLPLACLWRRTNGLAFEGRLVTAFVAGALPIDRVVRRLMVPEAAGARNRGLDQLSRRMVELLCALGRHGFYHRDLKAGNILVSEWNCTPQVWLVDLDGVGREQQPCGAQFSRSLARLVASLMDSTELQATHFLRALRHFDQLRGECGSRWKPSWRQIEAGVSRFKSKRGTDQAWGRQEQE